MVITVSKAITNNINIVIHQIGAICGIEKYNNYIFNLTN